MEKKPEFIADFFNTCRLCGVSGLERWAVKLNEEGLVVCKNEFHCQRRPREQVSIFSQVARHNFGRENVIDFGLGLIVLKKQNAESAQKLVALLVGHIFNEFCAAENIKAQKNSLELFSATADYKFLAKELGQDRIDGILKKFTDPKGQVDKKNKAMAAFKK